MKAKVEEQRMLQIDAMIAEGLLVSEESHADWLRWSGGSPAGSSSSRPRKDKRRRKKKKKKRRRMTSLWSCSSGSCSPCRSGT